MIQAGRPENDLGASDQEPTIYDVYRKEANRQHQRGIRSNRIRRLGEVMLSPQVLADIRASAYQPLTPEQLAINEKGYNELAERVAKLKAKGLYNR